MSIFDDFLNKGSPQLPTQPQSRSHPAEDGDTGTLVVGPPAPAASPDESGRRSESDRRGVDRYGMDRRVSDRRGDDRETLLYRPCCIQTNRAAQFGLIRNWSNKGALVETALDLQEGDTVSYFWDASPRIDARIAWVSDGRVGLEHLNMVDIPDPKFQHRTVRIPVNGYCTLWLGDRGIECRLANLSLTGAQLDRAPPMETGSLVSITVGNTLIQSCTVRWAQDNTAGLAFGCALRPEALSRLLEQAADDAPG